MDPRLATKTPLEREDDEAARHVRPAPKQRPPRQDLRRNQDHAESGNPDSDDASDRKDRSLNYKNVGGSLTENVVRRFQARRPQVLIPAKNRETGKVVMISPSTLKTKPGQYTPVNEKDQVKEEDKGPPKPPEWPGSKKNEPAPESKPEPEPEEPKSDEGFRYGPPPGVSPQKAPKPKKEEPEGDFYYGPPKERSEAESPEDDWSPDEDEDDTEADEEDPSEDQWAPDEEPPEKPVEEGAPAQESEAKPEPEAKPEAKPEVQPEPQAPAEAKPEPEGAPADGSKDPEKAPEEAPKEQEKPEGKASPEAEKKPKAPKKNKPKKGEPDAQEPEEPAEEAKTPAPQSLTEKAGIAPPKRREATRMEQREAASLLVNTFPPDVAANIMATRIHPDDVWTLVRKYNAAKAGLKIKDPAEFAAKMAGVFQTDPNQVPPPSKWKGQPLSLLSPEEQSEAARQHQLQVMALSLAAQEGLTQKLSRTGILTGKPQVPPSLASNLASVMLSPVSDKNASLLADKTFNETLESGKTLKMSDGAVKRLLGSLKGSPAATGVAKAFLQANDYQTAKSKFLNSGSISEWDTPRSIFKGLTNASRFFESRNALYGDDTVSHPASSLFRTRLMSRLKSLNPKRYMVVQAALPKLEESEYRRQMKAWGPKFKEWERRREAHQSEVDSYLENPKGKPPGPFADPEPPEPRKPVTVLDEEEDGDIWKAAFEDQDVEEKAEKKPEKKSKKNSRPKKEEVPAEAEKSVKKAAGDYGFTYPTHLVMGSAKKLSVYHGIDPYAYGPASYPGWLQPHQRDLADGDMAIIESSAQEWLKSPLLTTATDGMPEDARLRMALDLAIYSGPYNGAINPNLYDRLLTNLGGTSSFSVRVDADTSTFTTATDAGGENMKASNQLRTFAAKVAGSDRKLAYEMLEFADRLAEDEEKGGMPPWLKDKVEDKKDDDKEQKKEASDKYAALRSEVIKAAAAAGDRTPFLPVLQTIKNLG